MKHHLNLERDKQVVVCAAILLEDGTVITGARHYDPIMHKTLDKMGITGPERHRSGRSQGFINQYGTYLTRNEAFRIAARNGQISEAVINRERRHDLEKREIFSEDLY